MTAFVLCSYVNRSTHTWHVDVNNPTSHAMTLELSVAMPEAQGLMFPGEKSTKVVEVLPGQMLNVL